MVAVAVVVVVEVIAGTGSGRGGAWVVLSAVGRVDVNSSVPVGGGSESCMAGEGMVPSSPPFK